MKSVAGKVIACLPPSFKAFSIACTTSGWFGSTVISFSSFIEMKGLVRYSLLTSGSGSNEFDTNDPIKAQISKKKKTAKYPSI